MPVLWSVRTYVSERGVDEIRAEHDNKGVQVRARFLGRLKTIVQMPRMDWPEQYIKKLSGPCSGLLEIRFKADNVQQRPLGFVSGDGELTLLFWAIEKGDNFVPPTACEIALRRKQEVITYRSRSHAIWLALE